MHFSFLEDALAHLIFYYLVSAICTKQIKANAHGVDKQKADDGLGIEFGCSLDPDALQDRCKIM